jgi:hypothetical protein
VLRVKVEAPLEDHEGLGRPGQYFRWHGKLRLRDASALQQLCEEHGARLSRDDIGDEPDIHVVTLRSHEPLVGFKARVAALAAHLEREGWPLMKQHSQICLHDSSLQAAA